MINCKYFQDEIKVLIMLFYLIVFGLVQLKLILWIGFIDIYYAGSFKRDQYLALK